MRVPNHIAIIMDGNGRWAKKRGLPRTAGHKKGVDRVREIAKEAKRLGVKIITVFAFSTENWNRSRAEIGLLFLYLTTFLNKYEKELMDEDMRLNVIGRRDRINKKVIKRIEEVEASTQNNKSFTLNIALDYGGRWDITEAVRNIIKDYSSNKISRQDLEQKTGEETFRAYLCLADMPDPDLLVRTSGEQRISNFLLWNLAYAELYFSKVFWPDFDKAELKKTIEVYSQRERRFGKA